MKTRGPLIANRDAALFLGLLAYFAGAILLWDAYENRGLDRPRVLRALDGARALL